MAKERLYDDLWYSSPVQVFEKARDAASDAIDIATNLIELAREYRDKYPHTPLSAIFHNHKTVSGQDYSDLLSHAIHRFQTLLDTTPIKRFLDQYDKPISLETLLTDAKGRSTASSYHDLALAVGCQLSESIARNLSVADYLNHLRYLTAAGDWIPEHVANIKSYVACECSNAIKAWRKNPSEPADSIKKSPFLLIFELLNEARQQADQQFNKTPAKADERAAAISPRHFRFKDLRAQCRRRGAELYRGRDDAHSVLAEIEKALILAQNCLGAIDGWFPGYNGTGGLTPESADAFSHSVRFFSGGGRRTSTLWGVRLPGGGASRAASEESVHSTRRHSPRTLSPRCEAYFVQKPKPGNSRTH